MAVTLTDVHISELAEQGKADPWFGLAHTFVIAVNPEGSLIWQSWGKFGYRQIGTLLGATEGCETGRKQTTS
jgi:hypothetical protein